MIFSLVEEVPFAAIVDKRYGIDRAESLLERRTAARFEMKSGNSSRAGSAPDKRVGIELERGDRQKNPLALARPR